MPEKTEKRKEIEKQKQGKTKDNESRRAFLFSVVFFFLREDM